MPNNEWNIDTDYYRQCINVWEMSLWEDTLIDR